MKKIALQTLALVVLSASFALPAQAQELKIGYVNLNRILRESNAVKEADTKLEAEFGKRNKELVEGETRLKTLGERLQKDLPTLAESERSKREKEALDLEREVQRKRREFQEDVLRRRNEEQSAIIERADRVVRKIVEQERYDLIIQEAVYWSPRIDITDKVIKAMNTPTK